MTPEQAAHDAKAAVVGLPGRFMTDAATFARGRELGFDGFDFYVAGRAGVLGDVSGEVAAAAMVFFAPELVRDAWERAANVMPRAQAAREWASCGHVYAVEHLESSGDDERLATLLSRVVDGASASAAPLFAGFRLLGLPQDPKARVLHQLNALRELRGALHGAAVLTVGLSPLEAIAVRTPDMAALFGWPGDVPDAAPLRDRWALAEARTDRMLGRHFTALDDEERGELVGLLDGLT